MSDDRLRRAAVLLDAAIEHANRWPHGLAEGWPDELHHQAAAAMENAIALLQKAVADLISTDPGGVWGGFEGEPSRPFLNRALSLAFEARGIVGRALAAGDIDPEALRRADQAIGEAWEIMGGVAVSP